MGYAFDQYVAIVVFGAIFAFLTSYGIGCNDIANSFATSIASKSISLRQMVVLGSIFEFIGAVVLGGRVASTIRDDIISVDDFEGDPALLMYAMMCALLATGFWLILASALELPVSTTQSIIGAITGVGIALKGFTTVQWGESTTEDFPYITGISKVVTSWFAAPILAGIAAMIFFTVTKFGVMRQENSVTIAIFTFPLYVAVVVTISVYLMIAKGSPRLEDELTKYTNGEKVGIAFGVGFGIGLIVACIMPFLKRYIESDKFKPPSGMTAGGEFNAKEISRKRSNSNGSDGENIESGEENKEEAKSDIYSHIPEDAGFLTKAKIKTVNLFKGLWNLSNFDPDYKVVESGDNVISVHERAQKYKPKTEAVFSYLQVFSACAMAFAHGSNDSANSIGPFATIWAIYKSGQVQNDNQIPIWIYILLAGGICVGLATYGYKIVAVLGCKLSHITPSRGMCVELGAALVIIFASRFGIPVSTTQCVTGGVIGVGIIEGLKGVNWLVFVKVFFGWVFTLFATAVISGLFAAQGAYAPRA